MRVYVYRTVAYRAASYRIVFVRSSSVSARYSDNDDGNDDEVVEVVVIDDTYIHSYVRTYIRPFTPIYLYLHIHTDTDTYLRIIPIKNSMRCDERLSNPAAHF